MTSVIKGALHILAPMICEREGVKLRFGGKQAYCSETEGIVLPDLPAGHEEAKIIGMAYLNHELEHFEDSDFSCLNTLSKAEAGMVNVLEDIRIETNRGRRFPGAKIVFEQVDELLVKEGAYVPQGELPYVVMHNYMLSALRHLCLGHRCMAEPAAAAREVLVKVLPPSVVVRLDVLMVKVATAASTQDCVMLAKAIMAMIEEEKQKQDAAPPPQNTPSNGQQQQDQGGQGQGEQGQGQNGDPVGTQQDSSAANQQQSSSNADNGQQGNPSQSGQQSSGSPEGGAGAGASVGEHKDAKDVANAMASILAGEGASGIEEVSEKLAEKLNTLAVSSSGSTLLGQPKVQTAKKMPSAFELVKQAEVATNALQRRLKALLQAKALSEVRHVNRGSRLDTGRLVQLKTGNINVFKRSDEGLALNTAIYVLIDSSGSMEGVKIELAKQASLATALAFGALKGVTLAVGAFPYHGYDVGELMTFGERAAAQSGQFAMLEANGVTPLAEAMLHAGKKLMQRRETRKLMLVVTDGAPGKRAACQSLISDMSEMGIEMIGLGINAPAICSLIETSKNISNIHELAPTMIELLQTQVLLNRAA